MKRAKKPSEYDHWIPASKSKGISSKRRPKPAPSKFVVLKSDQHIDYVALDPTPGGSNLGRAEFQFCPLWRDGIMRTLWIYRRQQRAKDSIYKLPLRGITTFAFESHGDSERPRAWRMGWCSEHGTVSYEVYVPNDTNRIEFDYHFGNSISIQFVQANQ